MCCAALCCAVVWRGVLVGVQFIEHSFRRGDLSPASKKTRSALIRLLHTLTQRLKQDTNLASVFFVEAHAEGGSKVGAVLCCAVLCRAVLCWCFAVC
jgi:hypothetical protein